MESISQREFIKEMTSHINNRNYPTIFNCPIHIFMEPFGVLCGKRDYLESNTALMWRREPAHVHA